MKFFIAYRTEPLQLKFINFVLGRTDVDKNTLLEAVKTKDETFKSAINSFTLFQSELKKWGTKIGNSSNIFFDCIYTQCAENDDSFKYLFGEENDERSYKKCYEHILNELYDAFKNSEDFSKEGRFMERAKRVFNGFKNKNVALETLVDDMNQILVDNNKNVDDEDDNRTMEDKENDSWNNLEANEVYRRGEWHVYQVDKYEDMRNVASKCSDWCVARTESGRSYFYETYSPPYYLFTRGRRKPTILMHIDSQQFKGLDDEKFEADRPTSYEAIKIGRDFLEKLGELQEYYHSNEDFSVFNEENTIPNMSKLDNEVVMSSATQEELLNMLDKTSDVEEMVEILKNAKDYELFSMTLDKPIVQNHDIASQDVILRMIKMNPLKNLNQNDYEKLYLRILDELTYCDSVFATYAARSMVRNVNNEKVISTIVDRFGYRVVETALNNVVYRTDNGAIVDELIKRNDREALNRVMESSDELSPFEHITKKLANNVDFISKVIEEAENKTSSTLSDDILSCVAMHTENQQIIGKVIDGMRDNYNVVNRAKLAKLLLNKIDDEKLMENLFKKCRYLQDNELVDMMLEKAKTSDQKAGALSNYERSTKLQKYCDMELENLDYASDRKIFFVLIKGLKDKKSIRRLVEKSGYDYALVSSVHRKFNEENIIDYDLIAKSVEKEKNLSRQQIVDLINNCNNAKGFLADNPYVTKIVSHILHNTTEDMSSFISTVFSHSNNNEVKKEILTSFQDKLFLEPEDLLSLSKSETLSGLISEDTIRRCVDYAIENEKHSVVKDIMLLPQCSNELAVEIAKKCASRKVLYFALKKGAFGDGIEFVKNEIMESSDKRQTITGIMSALAYNEGEKSDLVDRVTEYMLNSNLLSEQNKIDLAFHLLARSERSNTHKEWLIDCCVGHWDEFGKSLFKYILKNNATTEEQARKLMDLWLSDATGEEFDSDAILEKASSAVRKVLEEYEEKGIIGEIDWSVVASNKNATADDLMKAVKHIEDSEDAISHENQGVLYAILQHDNCTQEVAERAINLIEFDEWGETSDDDWNTISSWIGAEILEKTDQIGTYSKMEVVANNARNEKELEGVMEAMNNIGSGYEEEEGGDKGREATYYAIVKNSNCPVTLFDKVMEEGEGWCEVADFVFAYLSFHKEMPEEQFVAFIKKYENTIKKSTCSVDAIYRHSGLRGELFSECLRKFGVGKAHVIVDNKSLSDEELAEALEFVDINNEKEIVQSDMASDITYRKALDLNVSRSCLEIIAERTRNEKIKNTAIERIDTYGNEDYGVSAMINKTSDDTELKTLVTALYKKVGENRSGYARSLEEISRIHNKRALEFLSKTGNQKILTSVIININTSENVVLQILKKRPEKEILKAASSRNEKNILVYVGCITKQQEDINRIFKHNAKMLNSDDVMKMLRLNPSLKYDILRLAYFKLSDEQLASLKKLRDKDVDWVVDTILKKTTDNEKKSSRIVNKILKAERIARKILK